MLSLLLSDAKLACLYPACIALGHQPGWKLGSSITIDCLQEAAGAFAFLRDVAGLRVEQPRPVDISPEAAGEAVSTLWIII